MQSSERRPIVPIAVTAAMGLVATALAVGFGVPNDREAGDTDELGSFSAVGRTDAFLIAAPHGQSDAFTGDMAEALCARTGWSCLVARGFSDDGRRINVNRPTEGVRRADTTFTPRAARVYEAYLSRVQALAPRLQLYVELHGNNHPGSRNAIEIATVGISEPWAHMIEQRLTRALREADLSDLTPRIDVLEDIRYGASHNREFGVLSLIEPALHIELPEGARTEHRDAVVAALAEALPDIAKTGADAPEFASR